MNILVIGQNGREHALAVAYAKSSKVDKIIMTPGNGLTDYKNEKIINYPNVGMLDFGKIVEVCKKENIDVVDVAQDDIIAKGYVDKFTKLGIKAFGATKLASQLEWDKKWSRDFMVKYNLPIPQFKSFHNEQDAIQYVNTLPEQLLFIKASGLALGKGVIRADTKEQAIDAIKHMSSFGKSGETFLIEEGMIGEEFTLFAICDGDNYVITKSAQDHKTIYDGDKGPNTGGVGSIAPTSAITPDLLKEIKETIIKPTLAGMKKEGRPYSGILYVGGMITHSSQSSSGQAIKIIEFNARWGDPEAEVILPSIQTDYVDIIEAVINKKLHELKIDFDNKVRISVAGCAKGYPTEYTNVKGKEIFGLLDAMKMPCVTLFGSGITRKGNKFYANGGRIFYVVAEGKDIMEAREKAYNAMKLISIEGDSLHYRTDIGWRDIQRLATSH